MPKSRLSVGLSLLALGLIHTSVDSVSASSNEADSLQRSLHAHCVECHGSETQEGLVRFDRLAEDWSRAFELGWFNELSPEQGLVWQVLHGSHADGLTMPPETSLTVSELQEFTTAIRHLKLDSAPSTESSDESTDQQQPWLLVPLDVNAAPSVSETAQDFESPTASPESRESEDSQSRMRSLRRLHLDLTGLPPAADELKRYAADSRPDATARVIDRLMASPSYGERWARYWMDQARYGDSEGFDIDQPRENAWRYRTWLINSFNDDLPFDQFTFDQLAADLQSDGNIERNIGLGFLCQSTRNTEAGADPEEDLVRRSCDRLEATADIWLGLQLRCARCHDHPFQNISHRDYYRLLALFRNLSDSTIVAPTERAADLFAREAPAIQERVDQLKTTRESYRRNIAHASFRSWLANANLAQSAKWFPLTVQTAEAITGEDLEVMVDQSVFATGPLPDFAEYHVYGHVATPTISGIKLEALPHPLLPFNGPGRHPKGGYLVSQVKLWVHRADTPNEPEEVKLLTAWCSTGQPSSEVRHVIDPTVTKQNRFKEMWRVEEPKGDLGSMIIELETPVQLGPKDRLEVRIDQSQDDWMYTLGRFKISTTSSQTPIVDTGFSTQPWSGVEPAKYGSTNGVFEYFLLRDPNDQQLANAIKTLEQLLPEDPTTIKADVVQESDNRRPTTIYDRGDYEHPTDEVSPGLPSWFEEELGGSIQSRADFAKWLFAEAQRVTSRVLAARVYQRLTQEVVIRPDAGDSWANPTAAQQARIESLAEAFQHSGWSFKSLVREAILQREELRATVDLERVLEAEMIRDSLLQQSRLLNPSFGGRSIVMPQPLGRVEGAFSRAQPLEIGEGNELYVRGLYVWWQRTSPFPLFVQFGTPRTNTCETIRQQESTAIQALSLLNDPYIYDYVRHLTLDVYVESDRLMQSFDERLDETFLRVLGRLPAEEERARCHKLVAEFTEFYLANPALVEKILTGLLASPESTHEQSSLAAWIMMTRIIVNTPDFVRL